ncbi:GDSL esterase/lipase 1 [Camellia lanceoleosa]|uniref:GDSL esterase/lipase 1 n=1 Tax=Camellia lanceoleosa TaxID=1840588 RepID=A0ACC0FA51_9ERIC|nr:GDSL esterase/lipase 1 [Camellia lanceoleosa]
MAANQWDQITTHMVKLSSNIAPAEFPMDRHIVPDFIAAKLEPYLEPGEHNFSDGINFASAGSTVLGYNLNGQLNYLKKVEKWLKQKLGDAEAKNLMKIAVYLFSMGGNDYFQLSLSNPIATLFYQRHYFQMVIGNLKQVLKEGKAACCGTGTYRSNGCGGNNGTTQYELCSNPFEYVWFDSAHITEGTNLQLAKLLWSGSPMVTGPYNMKQLFDLL